MPDDLRSQIAPIHGDLFRDNALFQGGTLSGVIDFYHACDDFYVQDIAITINDWCKNPSGDIDENLKQSLITGYETRRPLEAEEIELLPLFQKIGAARFSLTRLLSGEQGEHLKDPQEFLQLLRKLENI
jgi:homoserine kinase type II